MSPLPANNPSYPNSLFPNAVDQLTNQPDPETAHAVMAIEASLIGGASGGAPAAPPVVPANLTVTNLTVATAINATQVNAPLAQVLWFGTNGTPNVWYLAGSGAFQPGTDNQRDLGAIPNNRVRNLYLAQGVFLGANVAAQGPALYGGSGVPAAGLGANGDFYFNSAGAAGTAIYQKRAGAWVGLV